MRGIPVASMVIGIASSPAARRQLAQLLGGTEAFLIVSSVDQAREFLGAAETPTAETTVETMQTMTVDVAPATVASPATPALVIDSDRRVARWLDREIELTRLEHDLLLCLMGAPGRVWTYERLHLKVWGNKHLGRGSDMHSVVRRIRRKLATLDASATIDSVRGVGFRLASA
ncbi:winged helix family transcriptional regulator [Micromonospora musae]|uniref:Winged helix family transcriptional regulator n=1 Tax=Micromonospora musae TaxID=1894970 RepID=A0A3A9YHQ7_9ACTN|nr:winged helix-turn-helix domain-containing protein [Micromonospora musae]RKN21251.1 winged helix family transcriptional regulator [Micromonospora musae]RKN36409.1 winged helix family transcriptional regulator [Micromonospora musae]